MDIRDSEQLRLLRRRVVTKATTYVVCNPAGQEQTTQSTASAGIYFQGSTRPGNLIGQFFDSLIFREPIWPSGKAIGW